MNTYPFVAASPLAYTHKSNRTIRAIVIHCTESPLKVGGAKANADWFAKSSGKTAYTAAHFVCDPGNTIQCVQCNDIAYAVRGFNTPSLSIEQTGYARFSLSDWRTTDGLRMLERVARLVLDLCKTFHIRYDYELTHQDIRDIARGARVVTGLTTHRQVTEALAVPGGHTDPGPNWQMGWLLDEVQRLRYVARVTGM